VEFSPSKSGRGELLQAGMGFFAMWGLLQIVMKEKILTYDN
jgi:hypothetical protein